jgi:hypothetical protein
MTRVRSRPAGAGAALCAGGCALAGLVALAACRGPSVGSGVAPAGQGALSAAKANERCYECHLDFRGEALTVVHQKHAVSCVRCHGHSQPHIDDEVRTTKPDAIFRGKAMAVFCLTCHEPARHRRQPAHAASAAREPAKRRSCTACHGEHKLLPL